ncbi:substrate-binding domain-containing protein [Mycolicibacterium mageritense]|uniref:substrate-binding domain-containing protein n=1 Tax=Mycolicibacterium mageritense TaxID=53462 RepID=UPI001E63FE84|nr:substrate-binding domain-containing protein [Mycolicibacterium mageritense]
MESGASPRVPAAGRAFHVMSDIAVHGPATLSELSRRLSLPKSSLLGICQALVDQRLLTATDGNYGLGLAIVELAAAYGRQPVRMSRVGVCVQNLDNPFFVAEIAAVRAAAAAQAVEVDIRDARQSLRRQAEQIDDLVADGVQALLLDSVDSVGIGPAVARSKDSGVPVVALNVGAEGADATVTTDNVAAGAMVGRYLAAAIGGRGRVAIVDGTFVTATADRVAGFVSALREYPDIEIVTRQRGDHSEASGRKLARRILAEHGPIDGFFGINDPTSLGVLKAVEEAGLPIPIVSVDGSQRAAAVLARGEGLIATAAQDPAEMARVGLSVAADIHTGLVPASRLRLLPPRLITPDAADYVPWDAE